MYPDLLASLCCPACGRALTLAAGKRAPDGDVLTGALACAGCAAVYPLRGGIADFLGPPAPPTPAQAVNEWRLTAWAYERVWRPFALTLLSGQRFPYRRELPLVTGLAGAEQGGLFVDVACSNGLYARALARRLDGRGAVVGIDHSLAMLDEARRRACAAGLRISYLRASAQALPIRPGAAAGVLIGGSLNEIGDLDTCLSEACRVLASGGRFVAMGLAQARSRAGGLLQRALAGGGVCFWPPAALVERLTRSGLRAAGLWRYGLVLFLVGVRLSEPETPD